MERRGKIRGRMEKSVDRQKVKEMVGDSSGGEEGVEVQGRRE